MGSQTVGAAYAMSEGQDASYEIVRRNGFVVTIEGLDVELKAFSTNLPDPEIETSAIYHGNERSQYATKPIVNDIRVEIYDYVGQSTVDDLWAWWKEVYNPVDGTIGFANEYKKHATIEVVDSKGNTVRTWYCQGLIIKRAPTPEENMTYDNHEAVRISLVMSCDWASLDGFNRQGIAGSAA